MIEMPRKGADTEKLEKINKILGNVGSKGIWIRELARQTDLPVSTVHFYINNFLEGVVKIEDAKIGDYKHSQMKIVKLKGR